MPHLVLALMGPFQVKLDGKPVEGLNSDYLRGLLAYLAVESKREHPREQVAALLWPERSDQEALCSLRYALSKLRAALGDRVSPVDRKAPGNRSSPNPFLLVTRTHVHINPASDHWLDVTEFQDLGSRTDLLSLEQAAALYRGPLLDGLSIGDSPAFEEWLLLKEEQIHRSFLSLLDRLTSLQMRSGENGQAARWARKQLELDPYREQAHRQLMTALTLGGDRSAALTQYEACRRLLNGELGCEPEDETQLLYKQIRDGALPKLQLTPSILSELPRPASPTAETRHAASVHASRFVSRQRELAKLEDLFDQALTGGGGVAMISGEAGSGKTALLEEFSRQAGLAHPELIALRGRCNAHGGVGDPFLPFREMLQTLAGDVESKRAGGTLSPEQARRVWEALPAVGAALVEYGPDLIDRFLPGEALLQRLESFSRPTNTARWQMRLKEMVEHSSDSTTTSQPDLFAQVTQVLHTLSRRTPLLMAIDDLQWADEGTQSLLFHLGRRLAGSRIMLVCAYRPLDTGQVSQGAVPGIGVILQELTREWGDILVDLDRADGQDFIEALIDSEPNHLGEDFRLRLYDHTGGNPLFTVELLRSFERQGMLVQDGAGRWIEAAGLDWNYCPPQVEAVISGHLTGLPDQDLELLQVAAIQGEQFAAEIAARILGWDGEAVLQRLSGSLRRQHRLVEAVSLDRLTASGQRLSHYRFRHALLQRSAYGSLDEVRKSHLHEATGRALESIYAVEGERPQALAPTLAWHYEAAGLRLKAARALHEAGHQALRLSAFRQALDLFDHGLALLADEPPTDERREIQRLLQVDRLSPERNLDGFRGPGLEDAMRQATEAGAGDSLGRPRLLMLLLEGERLMVKGQFESGLALAEQLLHLAADWDDMAFAALAHWRIGLLDHSMGNLQEAEKHFDWILEWITPEREAELRTTMGSGLSAQALIFSALDQWFLGYPEQALRRSAQAVAGKFEEKDLLGQALASAIGCTVLFLLRSDRAVLQERSELCLRLCQQQGFVMWQPYSEVFIGWLAVMRGEDISGVERMQRAIADWQSTGMAIGTDSLVTVLADGCLAAARQRRPGDETARLNLLETGLAAIDPLLGRDVPYGQSYQPELYRLKGELLLERDGLAAAEEALACFQQSLQLGREMGAPAWELRAAMSLVRLRMRQGEAYAAELAAARRVLCNLYTRFTEGYVFPDQQEAAALIGETRDE